MPAKLRFNSDQSLVEIETPEGESLELVAIETDEDGDVQPIFVVDEDNPSFQPYVAIVGQCSGLTAQTLYRLVPVETVVELDADLEEDEEGEEEDDEEDEGGVPA